MTRFISSSLNKKNLKATLSGIGVALFWLALWQIASMRVNQEILVASPLTVIGRLTGLLRTSNFYLTVARSIGRIMGGYLLALIAGIVMAVLTFNSTFLHRLLSPMMSLIKASPVASFIILALIWLRAEGVVIFSVFLMVLPMVWMNVYQGIVHTDHQLLEMADLFQVSRSNVIRAIYVPSILPHFMSAVTTGLGFAWKSGVAAEVLGSPKGSIGEALGNAKIYLETPDLFAWTIVVIAMSILIEKVVVKLIKSILRLV